MRKNETAPARLGFAPLLAIAAITGLVATLGLIWLMVQLTPPCGGPFCFYALLYLPLSAIGAAIVELGVGWYARRGWRGYLTSIVAGAAGYCAAWLYVIKGGPFAS